MMNRRAQTIFALPTNAMPMKNSSWIMLFQMLQVTAQAEKLHK
jgi:hypothetical protein